MADGLETVKPGTEPAKPEEKFVPQSEVDRIVSQRLEREKSKYSDYEAIKEERERLLAEKREREDAQLTEVERIKKEKETLASEVEALKQERDEHKLKVASWEEKETAKINEAMKDLSEDDKNEINALPLEKRMFFIEKIKGQKPASLGAGKGLPTGQITLESINEKKSKGDPTWRQDMETYNAAKGKRVAISFK